MAELCLDDLTNVSFYKRKIRKICESKWKNILKEYGREIYDLKVIKRTNDRITWNYLKSFLKKEFKVYSKLGYIGYAVTITRGDKKADIKELKNALRHTLNDLNREFYKDSIKGLELPIMTFEGNSVDENYNPHLHCYLMLPKGKFRRFKKKLKDELAKSVIYEQNPNHTKIKRKANKLWIEKIIGNGESYFGYCGREESPKHGKELDKIAWDLSSFGFASEPKHKISKRIKNRIYRKFPESETNSELFHRAVAMLHWIRKRNHVSDFLREFIPPLVTTSTNFKAYSIRKKSIPKQLTMPKCGVIQIPSKETQKELKVKINLIPQLVYHKIHVHMLYLVQKFDNFDRFDSKRVHVVELIFRINMA